MISQLFLIYDQNQILTDRHFHFWILSNNQEINWKCCYFKISKTYSNYRIWYTMWFKENLQITLLLFSCGGIYDTSLFTTYTQLMNIWFKMYEWQMFSKEIKRTSVRLPNHDHQSPLFLHFLPQNILNVSSLSGVVISSFSSTSSSFHPIC